jgi:hypothetical protein
MTVARVWDHLRRKAAWGRLAQLGEHQLDKLGVTGSSPVPPIRRLKSGSAARSHDDFNRLLVSIPTVVADAGRAVIGGKSNLIHFFTKHDEAARSSLAVCASPSSAL